MRQSVREINFVTPCSIFRAGLLDTPQPFVFICLLAAPRAASATRSHPLLPVGFSTLIRKLKVVCTGVHHTPVDYERAMSARIARVTDAQTPDNVKSCEIVTKKQTLPKVRLRHLATALRTKYSGSEISIQLGDNQLNCSQRRV